MHRFKLGSVGEAASLNLLLLILQSEGLVDRPRLVLPHLIR